MSGLTVRWPRLQQTAKRRTPLGIDRSGLWVCRKGLSTRCNPLEVGGGGEFVADLDATARASRAQPPSFFDRSSTDGANLNQKPGVSMPLNRYGRVRLRVMTLMYSPLRPVGRGSLQASLSQ